MSVFCGGKRGSLGFIGLWPVESSAGGSLCPRSLSYFKYPGALVSMFLEGVGVSLCGKSDLNVLTIYVLRTNPPTPV